MVGKKRRLSPLFWSIVLCAAVLLVFAWAGSVWGDPGPHGSRQCVNCHDPHAGPNGFFPACDTCHNGATAPAVSTHANRDFSGTAEAPFDLACTQCHDPHGSSNLWLIREAVRINPTLGITGPVVFTATTGLNSFDDGISLPATRLCLTCHNTPGNPGYPTQNHPGGANHMGGASYTGLDCTTCHPHDVDDDPATLDGFMPAGGCTGCHAMPQDNGDGLPPGGRRPVVDEFGATSHHVQGTVQDDDCLACHSMANHQQGTVQLKDPDLGQSLIYTVDPANLAGLEDFCLNCHDAGGAAANGGAPPFSDGRTPPDVNGIVGETWADSAHRGAGQTCADCHGGNGHGSDNIKLLPQPGVDALCYTCHTDGMVQNDALANNRPGGYVSADDIEEAFGKGVTHTLGATFTIGSDTFTLQCTTCHNPHLASGRYWDAENGLTPVSRPDFSDPANNPRAMGVTLWGNNPGEKMDDFAAQGSGSGGWYYSVARGGAIVFDQPAVYQPPKQGNDWNFEFGGQVLPDYTTLCLDCHSYRMSDANPPVNWGQGIPCTDNSVDPPNQRVECGAQHGLGAANKPSYWGDVGLYGNSGNPDPIFAEPGVTRGRGAGHFMRWPYDSAFRSAGINFVMACTDCHEAHGSDRGGMVRERFNVNANGDCGSGGDANPNGENCTDGGNWNSFCNACHYYYGGQHAGMSCGNASCHEANSPHRIIHVTGSGGVNLWAEPSRPAITPEIDQVYGMAGSRVLTVTFTQGVWSDRGQLGALNAGDFLLTDVNGDNPRAIAGVTHAPGNAVAVISMTAPLAPADLKTDLLATRGVSVWAAGDSPAGPWPVTIPSCLAAATGFQFDEPAGSSTVTGEHGFYAGTVNDPVASLPGDGLFYGDGVDNYVTFANHDHCLQATTALTLEARVKPLEMGSGATNTIQRIFARDSNQNYQLSVWRNVNWPTYAPPDGVGSFAFWVSPQDKHGGKWWKPVLTDYDACPIVAGHWYRVKVTWNTAKAGGIPADIYVDDQGSDGSGSGENWPDYANCTDAGQSQVPDDRKLFEGDRIMSGAGPFAIGVNVNNHSNNRFNGVIDWLTFSPQNSTPREGLVPHNWPAHPIYLPLVLK